jgi:hypothetical protein
VSTDLLFSVNDLGGGPLLEDPCTARQLIGQIEAQMCCTCATATARHIELDLSRIAVPFEPGLDFQLPQQLTRIIEDGLLDDSP